MPEVEAHLHTRASSTQRVAAAALNTFDIAIIQHECGIYGGQDGNQHLGVLAAINVPTVVVAHTVLANPGQHQRQVLKLVFSG